MEKLLPWGPKGLIVGAGSENDMMDLPVEEWLVVTRRGGVREELVGVGLVVMMCPDCSFKYKWVRGFKVQSCSS